MPERSDLGNCNLTPVHRRRIVLKAIRTIKTCITAGVCYTPIRIKGDFVNFLDDSGYELCLRLDNFER